MAGPAAYPMTTRPTSATAPRSEPPTSRPTRAVTPTIPRPRPSQAIGARRSARPVANAIASPASGTAAISSPVVELGSRVSALPSRTHGTAISMPAKISIQRQYGSNGRIAPFAIAIGSRISAARPVRAEDELGR